MINLLRLGRRLMYLSLSPFDYASRLINGKTDLPPLHLRREVGPLRTFETGGAEFLSYLRLLVQMRPNDRVLDIGCGCGLMALYLKDCLDEQGSYFGVDVHQPSINWCRRHISSKHQNFRFHHIDVKSLAYNAGGVHEGGSFVFPYDSKSFDVVLLKSVLTHIRPAEVENYLLEVARLLKDNGRCLATFFLLTQEQEALPEGPATLRFSFGTEEWRYVYEHSPESATAYAESYVLSLLSKYGLRLRGPIHYGQWRGRKDGLSFQDVLIIEKAS
jgi:ubiquinone/menaquinone biosynthesis C-methylase UbiE